VRIAYQKFASKAEFPYLRVSGIAIPIFKGYLQVIIGCAFRC